MDMAVFSLPKEIQYKILSYTYQTQNRELCLDIQHYSSSLQFIKEFYFRKYTIEWENGNNEDKKWLINDTLSFINDYFPTNLGFRDNFYNLISRSYFYSYLLSKNKPCIDIIYNILDKNIITQVNIIWGLLHRQERNELINITTRLYGYNLAEDDDIFENDFDYIHTIM